ncbi:MAG: hypothetical protein ABIH23_35920, partial [bacterium]
GVAYDLLWDLDGINLAGYREVIRVREDGKAQVERDGKSVLYNEPRLPERPEGIPPRLTVELSHERGKAPLSVTARANPREGSSSIYYTLGTNAQGIYENVRVCWELYGPEEEDYFFLLNEGRRPRILEDGESISVEVDFILKRPGIYRLRAATVDLAGRTSVVWKTITVED